MKYLVEDVLKNIMQLRGRNKITQKQMGEVLNVTEATYNRIESGKIALSYVNLTKIASYFNMTVIDLLTYPDVYCLSKPTNTTKVLVEVDVSHDEFIKLGLKDKIVKILNN